MVTVTPRLPDVGDSLVILGFAGAVTVKLVALVPVPPRVVTAIVPVVSPAGTVAVICVPEEATLKVAEMPWKATAVAPVKPVPAKVTAVPTAPEIGVKLVTVVAAGGGAVAVWCGLPATVAAGASSRWHACVHAAAVLALVMSWPGL